ncbi:Solute carrier family 22 member 8, partial [Armadillidium vulgare]
MRTVICYVKKYETPELRRRIFLITTVFTVLNTVYYGLSLNAVNFKLNPFLYMVNLLVISEIFPTEVRLQAVGTCYFISRISLVIAPYITDSLGSIYPWIPSVLFGSLSFVAGFASIFIPETMNKNLHETIVDLEEEARAMKTKKTEEEQQK